MEWERWDTPSLNLTKLIPLVSLTYTLTAHTTHPYLEITQISLFYMIDLDVRGEIQEPLPNFQPQ